MRTGSLVECIKDIPDFVHPLVSINRPAPKKGDIETVDCIDDNGALQLVGFQFTIQRPLVTCGFDPVYFREVQEPMDLTFVQMLTSERYPVAE